MLGESPEVESRPELSGLLTLSLGEIQPQDVLNRSGQEIEDDHGLLLLSADQFVETVPGRIIG